MKRLKIYLLVITLLTLTSCGQTTQPKPKVYDWNDGKCTWCGGELMYKSTGSKNHYICKICGKEYTFDKIMNKKETNNE